MEIQKTSNSQGILEKEEWNWRNQPAWLQTILQSYSHQDSMVLAQRQKYRSMSKIESPKDSTRKWLELINEYSKVAGYTINTEKSLAFLYTNNKKTEREIKERFHSPL